MPLTLPCPARLLRMLALSLLVSLAGCGASTPDDEDSDVTHEDSLEDGAPLPDVPLGDVPDPEPDTGRDTTQPPRDTVNPPDTSPDVPDVSPPGAPFGALCETDRDCTSGVCLRGEDGSAYCTKVCARVQDCGPTELWRCLQDDGGADTLCVARGERRCVPGQAACLEDNLLVTCNGAGTGFLETIECRATERCELGLATPACIPQDAELCAAGERFCRGQEVYQCAPNGFDRDRLTVCSNFCREGACVDQFCAPNELLCVGTAVHLCDSSGSESEFLATCPDRCRDGACIARVCTENSRFCEGSELKRCAADGLSSSTLLTCPNLCRDGACVAQVCEPGRRFCEGNSVELCDSEGLSAETIGTCTGGCEEGICIGDCRQPGDPLSVGCAFTAVALDREGTTDPSPMPLSVRVLVTNWEQRAVTVRITNAEGLLQHTVVIDPGQTATWVSPSATGQEGARFHRLQWSVESDGRVQVVQVNPGTSTDLFSLDASLLLPINTLGTSHTIVGYPSDRTTFAGYVAVANPSRDRSTSVTIRPTVPLVHPRSGETLPVREERVFTLQAQEVVVFMTRTQTETERLDISGTRVQALQPVAVFAGNRCANVPVGTAYCDRLETQVLPDTMLGTTYGLLPFAQRGTETTVVRVVALEGGTTLSVTPALPAGDVPTVLAAGEVGSFEINRGHRLVASRPVAVAIFAKGSAGLGVPTSCTAGTIFNPGRGFGDPSMVQLVPTNRWVRSVRLPTLNLMDRHRVAVMTASGATLRLDGAAFNPTRRVVEGTGWETVADSTLSAGTRHITSSEPMLVVLYSETCDASLGYLGGVGSSP